MKLFKPGVYKAADEVLREWKETRRNKREIYISIFLKYICHYIKMQCQRKVVDQRIVELIQRCADNRERALFVITGKSSVERIADIYSLWVNKTMLPKASILWCYEENIALSGYRQKQLTKLKHNRKLGIQKEITDEDTPQNLMLRHATIKFMYYKDTARALGQTYDILVLQEAAKVTPNILCHTIETIQGGGFIILVDSNGALKKGDMFIARMLSYIRGCENALIVNDVLDVVSSCRFNEKGSNDKKSDEYADETNHFATLDNISEEDKENEEIVHDNSMLTSGRNTLCPSGIIKLCLSDDQSNALEKIYENLFMLRNGSTDTVPNIISVTASRGRGKSALLGLLIASICVRKRQEMKSNTTETLLQNVPSDLEKILVIAPMANSNSGPFITIHPHCVKALETMGMVKGINYSVDVSQASNRGKKRTISGLSGAPVANQVSSSGSFIFNSNIFALKLKTICTGSSHVVSYIDSETIVRIHNMGESLLSSVLSSFDLVIVDEAASMPIPVVRTISGISNKGSSSGTDELNWGLQRHVILSSTVHGYEGTGRSLAIKLFAELEKMYSTSKGNTVNYTSIKLETPIRYNKDCNVEKFLNRFLLLNSDTEDTKEKSLPPIANTNFFVLSPCIFLPYFKGILPSDNDNPLEIILNSAYSLFTTSHYRNSPEDIRRMMVGDGGSQLTRHGIGVLIEKKDNKSGDNNGKNNNSINILSAVHFAFEGGSSYGTSGSYSSDGSIRSGDVSVQGHLAPGVLENYYQEKRQSSDNSSFSNILGLRVVRIATRPNAQGMGYGKTLMRGLEDFFSVSEKDLKVDAKTPYSSVTDIVQNVINWALEIKEPSNKETKAPILPPLLISKKDFQNNPRIIPAVSRCIDANNNSFIPKYISVSYGLSTNLLRFYALLGFSVVFIKTTQNNTTGEHSCIVVKEISSSSSSTTADDSAEQKKESKIIKMSDRLKALFTSWANDFSWRLIRESRGMLRHMDPELVLRMIKANDEYCRKNYDYYVNNLTREKECFKDSTIIGPHRTPLLSARDMLRISAVAGISSGRCSISYNSLSTSEEEAYSYGGNNGDDCYVGVSGWRLISDLFPTLIDYYFSESPSCFSTTTKPNKKQGLLASSGNSYTNTKTDEVSVLSLTPATLIVLLGAQMKGNLEWTATSSLNMPPSQSSQLLQRGIETIYNYVTSEQLKEAECKHENKRSPKL